MGAASVANAQSEKTPLQFNDDFSVITDNVYQMGQEWGRLLNIAYNTQNYKVLAPQRQKMEAYAMGEIRRLQTMKDIGIESKSLRGAMLRFLMYQLSMFRNAFVPLEGLSAESTVEAKNKAFAQLQVYAREEAAETAKLNEAQEIFAKKNGLVTEPAEGK